jgi:hypothetical protein
MPWKRVVRGGGLVTCIRNIRAVTLGGLVVNVYAVVLEVRGFKPGRGRLIFNCDKSRTIPFGGGLKQSVPCSKV